MWDAGVQRSWHGMVGHSDSCMADNERDVRWLWTAYQCILKEGAVAYFKALSEHFSGDWGKLRTIYVNVNKRSVGRGYNVEPPEYETGTCLSEFVVLKVSSCKSECGPISVCRCGARFRLHFSILRIPNGSGRSLNIVFPLFYPLHCSFIHRLKNNSDVFVACGKSDVTPTMGTGTQVFCVAVKRRQREVAFCDRCLSHKICDHCSTTFSV
jgi:hypothetical protein